MLKEQPEQTVEVQAPPIEQTPRSSFCRAEPTEAVKLKDKEQVNQQGPFGSQASGYHHLGWQSVEEFTGITGKLQVTNPSVRDNSGNHEFFASRFMAKQTISGTTRWLEAGWAEYGGGTEPTDTRRVYTWTTDEGYWNWYGQYALAIGTSYDYQIGSHLQSDGSWKWAAFIYYNNQWQLLKLTPLVGVGETAYMENYAEAYVGNYATDFYLPATRTWNLHVAKPGTGFQRWTPSFSSAYAGATQLDSYCYTTNAKWHDQTSKTC